MPNDAPEHCRLVLVTPEGVAPSDADRILAAALSGGDVASVIVPSYGMGDDAYQMLLEAVVPAGQDAGAAVIAAGDTRIAGRCHVDGIHAVGGLTEVRKTIREHAHKWIVGCGSAESRDTALALGESEPDYILFGKFGQDTHPEPHKRNLELAEWWAHMVEVPAILLAGSDLASVERAAATGVEFVALSRAVFEAADPAAAVRSANEVLAKHLLVDAE